MKLFSINFYKQQSKKLSIGNGPTEEEIPRESLSSFY